MKQKNLFLFFTLSLMMVLFTACGTKIDANLNINKSETKDNKENVVDSEIDTIIVYDNNGNEILKTSEQSKIEYFSELIGNSVENIDDENASTLYKSVPKDAVISYRYTMIHKKQNNDEDKVDFYVYENYPYITLKGIPVITPLTWELSEKDNEMLQNPTDDIVIEKNINDVVSEDDTNTEYSIFIYDKDDKKIKEISGQKNVDEISEIMQKAVEKGRKGKTINDFKEILEDAKVEYRYEYIQKEDFMTVKINFYLYENYPYFTMKDIPFLPDLTVELSEEDIAKLKDVN